MLIRAALISLLGISASAFAGQWQVKVGASSVAPTQDTTVAALGNAVVEADQEYAFTPSVEYFLNDKISAELLLATPVRHDVLINGAEAVRIKHLPPTLTAKYHFSNATRFTPYIGFGATAFVAWDEKGVDSVKEDFGYAGQVGFNYQPEDAKNWGIYADVRYADLNPKVKVNDQTEFKLDIDPLIYTVGYSYKF